MARPTGGAARSRPGSREEELAGPKGIALHRPTIESGSAAGKDLWPERFEQSHTQDVLFVADGGVPFGPGSVSWQSYRMSMRWLALSRLTAPESFLVTWIWYAEFYSRSHDAVIHVYDDAGNVIETHEQAGEFKSRKRYT